MEQNLEILVRAVIASYTNRGMRSMAAMSLEKWLKHRTGEVVLTKDQLICLHLNTKMYNLDQESWLDVLGPFVCDVLVAINKDIEKEL